MTRSDSIESWLANAGDWASSSIHRSRLRRALYSANQPPNDPRKPLHSFSRLGVWAKGLSEGIRTGEIAVGELDEQLQKLAEFGELAFTAWMTESDFQDSFRKLLHDELIPQFCSDSIRNCDVNGFQDGTVHVADIDARDFMRAWAGGLVNHEGRGLYRASRSAASEQFFWTGPRKSTPRTFSLWHEPVITVAALARLHFDFMWPSNLIGTQSCDWAFDLVAFSQGSDCEQIAGEVKKSVAEVETLIRLMEEIGSNPEMAIPSTGKALNAYKKVAGLRARRAPIFWALGPNNCSHIFHVHYAPDGRVAFQSTTEDALRYDG